VTDATKATERDETPMRERPRSLAGMAAQVTMPSRAIGQVVAQDGSHRGWIAATDEAVLGTVQYVSDRQVMITLTHGKVTHLGTLADLERGALVALCPLVDGNG
jgi:hypothetical protein